MSERTDVAKNVVALWWAAWLAGIEMNPRSHLITFVLGVMVASICALAV